VEIVCVPYCLLIANFIINKPTDFGVDPICGIPFNRSVHFHFPFPLHHHNNRFGNPTDLR